MKSPSEAAIIACTLLRTTERDDTARVDVLDRDRSTDRACCGLGEFESEEVSTWVKDGDSWLIEIAPFQLATAVEAFLMSVAADF